MSIVKNTVMVSTLILALSGCSNMSERQQRTLSGGAIGAVAGAGIGAISGGSAGTGALVGAGIGAIGGALMPPSKKKKH